ncbi:MAG: nitroreductase family deazaflavin-dependent oxidoreductase [Thaumarchaeota archaeon]|nr:nitroreductase family deazaflavin-dependent oxidoreductase [Nitrososphaerota archaeon]
MQTPQTSKMQEQFLYLTTRGWKSGNSHKIEIWFVEHEGSYYIVSDMREHSHWVQNIRHDSSVTFRVGKKTFTGSSSETRKSNPRCSRQSRSRWNQNTSGVMA